MRERPGTGKSFLNSGMEPYPDSVRKAGPSASDGVSLGRYDRGLSGGPPLVFAAVKQTGVARGVPEPSPKRRKDGP